jgi:hypothetical protein
LRGRDREVVLGTQRAFFERRAGFTDRLVYGVPEPRLVFELFLILGEEGGEARKRRVVDVDRDNRTR